MQKVQEVLDLDGVRRVHGAGVYCLQLQRPRGVQRQVVVLGKGHLLFCRQKAGPFSYQHLLSLS